MLIEQEILELKKKFEKSKIEVDNSQNKSKVEKVPSILKCECGVEVKVGRYKSDRPYICGVCRKKKGVL